MRNCTMHTMQTAGDTHQAVSNLNLLVQLVTKALGHNLEPKWPAPVMSPSANKHELHYMPAFTSKETTVKRPQRQSCCLPFQAELLPPKINQLSLVLACIVCLTNKPNKTGHFK